MCPQNSPPELDSEGETPNFRTFMRTLLKLAILGTLVWALTFQASADTKKAPEITRGNFVSLEFLSRADKDWGNVWLRLDNGGLRIKFQPAPKTALTFEVPSVETNWSAPAPMSNEQIEASLKFLNAAQLPKNVGLYYGKSKVVGLAEVLTLTLNDDQQRDQKFEIQNYGDAAPRAYYEVTAFLRKLQIQKFSAQNLPIPAPAWTTSGNFRSLVLQTSGGFAGLRSTLAIKPRPMTSSIAGWVVNWLQTIAGRETIKSGGINFKEEAEIIRLINEANFAKLNGQRFQQPGLADGFNETLTLTLSSGQTFTVSNYGDQAPPEFLALTQYLGDLQQKLPTDKPQF